MIAKRLNAHRVIDMRFYPQMKKSKKEIDELGLTDTITPEDVRNHIGKCLYELFCKEANKNKDN